MLYLFEELIIKYLLYARSTMTVKEFFTPNARYKEKRILYGNGIKIYFVKTNKATY